MPEVLLDPIILNVNATVAFSASRITYVKGSLDSKALINGKIIKIVNNGSKLNANASLSLTKSWVIKHIHSNISGVATVTTSARKFKTVSGHIKNESNLQTFINDREIRESMLSYLPQYYQDFRDFRSLIVSEANEFTRLYALLNELFMQFNIDTATYSLNDWQKSTDARISGESTIQEQRNAVKLRINGIGTVTPKALKSVVDSFYESEMTELPTPGVIQFRITGRRGKPDNLSDIESAVNEVIPRHLEPTFLFSYLPWSEVDESNLKWAEADDYTYKGLEEAYLL